MSAAPTALLRAESKLDPSMVDHRVVFHGVTWKQYEALLDLRGEAAGPRMTYLEGELELMSPSLPHEAIKSLWGRLIDAYADDDEIELSRYGSWTLRKAPKKRGIEPDECYVLGGEEPKAPDLALEVVWTHGLVDRMEVYRGLGIREVWVWTVGQIEINVLRQGRYHRAVRSELLPGLDLRLLARYLGRWDQTRAIREFRRALARGRRRGPPR